jgi:hypothetical protein
VDVIARSWAVVALALAALALAPSIPTAAQVAASEAVEQPVEIDDSSMRAACWELRIVPWEQLYTNGQPPMRRRTREPADARGVPLLRWRDGSLVYNPTVLAESGLRRLDSWRQTGARHHLRIARAIARHLDREAIVRGALRWQPHRYDHRRQGLRSPWVNANSHGLVLSFFSRFHALTGEARYRRAADGLFEAYRRLRDDGRGRWFSLIDRSHHLWLEHYPSGRQRRVLNAHLNGAFGLYDYWLISGAALASDYLRATLTTVRDRFEDFRRPAGYSAYSLYRPHFTSRYHRTHILQLRHAARISGDILFEEMATTLAGDRLPDDAPPAHEWTSGLATMAPEACCLINAQASGEPTCSGSSVSCSAASSRSSSCSSSSGPTGRGSSATRPRPISSPSLSEPSSPGPGRSSSPGTSSEGGGASSRSG